MFKPGKNGFSFVEIMLAVLVAAVLTGGLMFVSTRASVTTAKTEAYYQALQLAVEMLDWIQTIPVQDLDDQLAAALSNSLIDLNTYKSNKLPVSCIMGSSKNELYYPDSYARRAFYRKVELEKTKGDKERFLIKAKVTVSWNEGDDRSEDTALQSDKRLRNLSLATLVLNEKEFY